MDLSNGDVGHQEPPPPMPPPPICSCCFRGNSDTSQIYREIFRGHHHLHSLQSIIPFYDTDPQEAIKREIEKDAIRQEIIASEAARRRRLLLEDEVRRELMAQLANGCDPGLSFTRLAPHSAEPALEGGISSSYGSSPEAQKREGLQGQKPYENISGSKKKPESPPPGEVVNTKNPTIEHANGLLFTRPAPHSAECLQGQKPYEIISGSKKKAKSPPPGEIVNTKKPKKDWSCEICQINSTSERALADHLRGRKHKAKEATSGSKKAELPTLGEMTEWSCAICQIISTSEKALNDHLQGRKHKAKEAAAGGFRTKKPGKICTFDPCAKEAEDKKSTGEKSKVQKRYMKRFQYWCVECNMGAYNMKTFLKHKEHRHNGQVEGHDRIRYTRDLLIQLREAFAQVPKDILKLKQEVEAEISVDPSWSRGEKDASLSAAQELDLNSKSDEFKRKTNSLLEDYFSSMLVEVVRESILSGLEKSPPYVEPVLKLLTSMFDEKVVSANDIEAGCLVHAESLEDLPKAPDSFGEIVGGLVLAGVLNFKVVGEILGKVGDDFYGKAVFSGVMKVVGSGAGGKEILDSQAADIKVCESLF